MIGLACLRGLHKAYFAGFPSSRRSMHRVRALQCYLAPA